MDNGFNHELDREALAAAGIHLTIAATGQILVIKQRVARGQSRTLYKWTGKQPQVADLMPAPGETRSIN